MSQKSQNYFIYNNREEVVGKILKVSWDNNYRVLLNSQVKYFAELTQAIKWILEQPETL